MGYYTVYKLEWEAKEVPAKYDLPEDLNLRIANYIRGNEEMSWCLNDNGSTCQSGKFYEWRAEMKAMSKEFPGVLFTLHGTGDEAGDIWKAYFLNGKMQEDKARIVFDGFSMENLKA